MDIVELGMDVDSRPLKRTGDEMDRFVRQGRRVDGAARGVEQSSRAMAAGVSAAAKSLVALVGAAASISAISRASQSYTQMTNVMRSMGQSADQAAATIQAIADVAARTRAPLEATAKLYQRISIAGRDLGASSQEVLRFTENVGLALAQSGTSATEASGALLQLSQAMAGGTVRAEEFNSILEGAFPIALAAAQGIDAAGGSVGRLRQLVIEGKISSDAFFNAILSQTDSLEAAFANTDATIGQALQRVSDSFTLLIGSMDQATGASAAIAEGIIFLADNLQLGVTIAGTAAVAFGTKYVAAMVLANTSTLTLAGSMKILRGALVKTGIGALIVGAGVLVDFLIRLRTATGSWGEALSALGDLAAGVWEGIKSSAQAIVPAIQSVWFDVQAGFLAVLENMALRWGNFLWSLGAAAEDIPGLDGFAQSFKDASDRAIDGMVRLNAESSTAAANAARLRTEASSLATQGFDKAREAATRLMEIVNAEGEVSAEAADEARALANELGGVGGAAGKTEKEVESLRKEIERLEFEADPVAKYNAELAKLQELREFGLSDDAFRKGVQDLNDELANQVPLVNDVASAWGEFVANGFRDFKGFVDSVLGSFKNMIAQMIATAARNRILISLGLVGGGGIGTAASAAGALGGGGGGLLGLGNIFGGGGGILGGILGTGGGGLAGLAGSGGLLGGVGSIASGVSGVLSGGGIASSFANLGGLLSGSLGGLGAIGAALPAIGLIGAGIGLVAGLFKKKKKEIDRGLILLVEGIDATVQTFQVIKKSNFFSSSTSTKIRDADEEIAGPILDLIKNVTDSTEALAAGIGVSFGEIISQFTTDFRISTKDLDDSEIQAAIEGALGELSDEMARQVLASAEGFDFANRFQRTTQEIERFGTISGGGEDKIEGLITETVETTIDLLETFSSKFAKEGERASETLQRLSLSLQAVNPALKLIQDRMFEISIVGADMASQLVDLFGGIENFTTSTSFFFETFFSEAERIDIATRELTAAFHDLGLLLPKTRDEFRELVQAQDTSTESGREMFAALVQLSGQMDFILPQFEQLDQAIATVGDTIAVLTGDVTSAITSQISQLRNAAAEASSAADVYRRLAQNLRAVSDSIGDRTVEALGATFDQLFRRAIGGDTAALESLGRAGQDLATASGALAGSSVEQARAEALIRNQIKQAAAVSEVIATGADYQAKLFEVASGILQVMQDDLQNGTATIESLKLQEEALARVNESIAASAKMQVVLNKDGTGRTIGAILDGSGNVIAGLDATTAKELNGLLDGLKVQSLFFQNEITGQTSELNASTQLTQDQLADAIMLEGRSLSLAEIVADATQGNMELSKGILAKLNAGIQVTGLSTLIDSNSGIIGAINDLRDAIQRDADIRRFEAAALPALDRFDRRGGTVVDTRQRLQQIMDQFGVTTVGGGFTIGKDGSLVQGSRAFRTDAASFEPFKEALRAAFGVTGGTINSIVGNILDDVNDPFLNISRRLDNLRRKITQLGGVPSFASGGLHSGGLRVVGEHGPELEATGPSRIFSARETRGMLGGGAVMADLLNEVRGMRDEAASANREIRRYVKKTADLTEKADKIGAPPERAEL